MVEAGGTHDPSETEVVAELRATIGLEGLGTPAAPEHRGVAERSDWRRPLAVVWIGDADGQAAAGRHGKGRSRA